MADTADPTHIRACTSTQAHHQVLAACSLLSRLAQAKAENLLQLDLRYYYERDLGNLVSLQQSPSTCPSAAAAAAADTSSMSVQEASFGQAVGSRAAAGQHSRRQSNSSVSFSVPRTSLQHLPHCSEDSDSTDSTGCQAQCGPVARAAAAAGAARNMPGGLPLALVSSTATSGARTDDPAAAGLADHLHPCAEHSTPGEGQHVGSPRADLAWAGSTAPGSVASSVAGHPGTSRRCTLPDMSATPQEARRLLLARLERTRRQTLDKTTCTASLNGLHKVQAAVDDMVRSKTPRLQHRLSSTPRMQPRTTGPEHGAPDVHAADTAAAVGHVQQEEQQQQRTPVGRLASAPALCLPPELTAAHASSSGSLTVGMLPRLASPGASGDATVTPPASLHQLTEQGRHALDTALTTHRCAAAGVVCPSSSNSNSCSSDRSQPEQHHASATSAGAGNWSYQAGGQARQPASLDDKQLHAGGTASHSSSNSSSNCSGLGATYTHSPAASVGPCVGHGVSTPGSTGSSIGRAGSCCGGSSTVDIGGAAEVEEEADSGSCSGSTASPVERQRAHTGHAAAGAHAVAALPPLRLAAVQLCKGQDSSEQAGDAADDASRAADQQLQAAAPSARRGVLMQGSKVPQLALHKLPGAPAAQGTARSHGQGSRRRSEVDVLPCAGGDQARSRRDQ